MGNVYSYYIIYNYTSPIGVSAHVAGPQLIGTPYGVPAGPRLINIIYYLYKY